MKNRFLILLFAFTLIFIIGCDQPNNDDNKNIELNFTNTDFSNLSLYISNLDYTLDLSNDEDLKEILLNLELTKTNDSSLRETKYILSFSSYEFTIYDNGIICYIDNNGEYDYLVSNNNVFDYFDSLYNNEELNFNKYTNDFLITVYNSNDDSNEITDKEAFIENLNKVKYYQLNNIDKYVLGKYKFKIKLNNDIITIYDRYFTIDNNLYFVIDGDFKFLNDIKFSSSSGWLPWI